jgi:nucleoside 2-deoxyribosyltransferase
MKFYIASPFFNPTQLQYVIDIENMLSHIGVDYFSPRSVGIVSDFKSMSDDVKLRETKRIFDANISNIHSCDGMIGVIDDHDSGTMFEIGYASRIREFSKYPLITTSNKNYGLNIMLMHAVDCHVLGIDNLKFAIMNSLHGAETKSQFPMDDLS